MLRNKDTPQTCPLNPEEDDLSADIYEDAIIGAPIYTIGQDSQLGGYIDVKKAGGQNRRSIRSSMSDQEVGLLVARSVNLNILGEMGDEGEGEGQDHAHNKYLTIVRDTHPGDTSPAPPVHVRRGCVYVHQ